MKTLWESATVKRDAFPVLQQDLEADVCIVGGGITGITAALLLAKAGKNVALLEAETLGYGTTGSSSNHLNTQIDFSYHNVEKKFDKNVSRIVAISRAGAINLIERNVIDFQIDCGFKRVNGFLYTEREDEISILEHEYEACLRAGLPVEKTTSTSLPFPVKMAIKFKNQAAFNSLQYIEGLAQKLTFFNGRIFENSRVVDLDKDTMTVKTQKGSVKAKQVFLATHIPLFINLHQTTSSPWRSYMIALKVQNYPDDALYWDMFEPYHYTRIYEHNGERWLTIGGADHKTGHNDKKRDYYKDLEAYARLRYNVEEVNMRWSQQFFEPSDGLPYIGLSPLGSTYMATGFSGDGLVYGTVAAMIISDQILDRNNDWIKAYDSKRFKPVASAEEFLKHNIDVMKHLIADRFTTDDIKNLKANQGMVVRKNNENYAVCKDAEGNLSVNSAVCTHMGCIIHWNHMDKCWDCGCHGSQFSTDGKVLIGPATKDLNKVDESKLVK